MYTKVVLEIIKLFLSGKKGRKWLKRLLLFAVILVLLLGAAITGTGISSVSTIGNTLSSIWEQLSSIINMTGNSKENWAENVTAAELLEAFQAGGYSLSEKQEKDMRMSPGSFEYLLRKVDNYEKSCQMTRMIKVQGLHEYIEVVSSTSVGEDGKEHTETSRERREEYVYQSIEVGNGEIESLHQINWRPLYIYSLMSAVDRRGVMGSESILVGNSWLIQEEDIDKAFDALSMKFNYAFDVLRDVRDTYDYEGCQQLPHVQVMSGDPDTEEGKFTYYYPRSLLNSASSGFSTMVHTQEGGMITGVEEIFSAANFDAMGKTLCKYYNYKYLSALLNQISGGTSIRETFDWYILQSKAGNAVIQNAVYRINPGAFQIQEDGRYSFDGELMPDYQDSFIGDGSVGAAAVETALSRLDWKYSQALRYSIGYWDCSSMVSRIYHELGVEIPISSTTSSLYLAAVQKNQVVSQDQLQPGDILFFKTQEGIKNKNPQGVGHIVMYTGNGMIVHAASVKSGTRYQTLTSYYNYPGGLICCARPYTNVISSYIPPAAGLGQTQASEIAKLDDAAVVSELLEMAREDYKTSGILPSITTAQMILESGYCRSKLSKNSNNCFGIKTGSSVNAWPNSTWDGISICVMNTKEQDASGKEYVVSASFRKYSSIESSMADHSAYLLGARKGSGLRYAGLTSTKSYREAATIIKNGGYATDVKYIEKLCSLIVKYGLDKYDSFQTVEANQESGRQTLPEGIANQIDNYLKGR